MSSIRLLPAPKATTNALASITAPRTKHKADERRKVIPPYLNRATYVPRSLLDFGDGGAFPEIHIAQYPCHLGRKDRVSNASNNSHVLAIPVTSASETSGALDAVISSQGQGKKIVYSGFKSLVEKRMSSDTLRRPSAADEQETAAATREALELLVQGKITAAQPLTIARQKTAKESSTYYRYNANPKAPGYNPKAATRVIRMVEAPVDPMQPPKFKHRKAPRGPPSPPVPVLHSPPRKITVKDQQSWKIPPCVSNWKNAKGYTIPLDKRLAADGRGLSEITINDHFASLSEALSIAERKAREEVNVRAKVQKKLAMKEKEAQEVELRHMASHARQERTTGGSEFYHPSSSHPDTASLRSEETTDARGIAERDAIRRDRKREREREMRLENLGKKGKLARDDDRDVSEKIALGQLSGVGKGAGGGSEGLFDSRLFNQSQGMSSGFGAEDDYSVYSKALADRGAASSIYRPKASEEETNGGISIESLKSRQTDRFKPDTEFQGTDRSGPAREGPVQFEKEAADPFGLDAFLTDARKGRKGGKE